MLSSRPDTVKCQPYSIGRCDEAARSGSGEPLSGAIAASRPRLDRISGGSRVDHGAEAAVGAAAGAADGELCDLLHAGHSREAPDPESARLAMSRELHILTLGSSATRRGSRGRRCWWAARVGHRDLARRKGRVPGGARAAGPTACVEVLDMAAMWAAAGQQLGRSGRHKKHARRPPEQGPGTG